MADYIKGLNGGCCDDCTPDNACTAKPVVTDYPYAATEGVSMYFGPWGTNTPTSRSVTGTLPPGVSFSGTDISGTPTAAGPYTVTLGASNACGSDTGILSIQVESIFCHLTLNTSGGDAGYDQTFDVTGDFSADRNVYVDFESYTVKDQLLIYANAVLVYDSGCIGAHVTPTILMPAGTTSVRVNVVPNCEGTTGTAWLLSITCA